MSYSERFEHFAAGISSWLIWLGAGIVLSIVWRNCQRWESPTFFVVFTAEALIIPYFEVWRRMTPYAPPVYLSDPRVVGMRNERQVFDGSPSGAHLDLGAGSGSYMSPS